MSHFLSVYRILYGEFCMHLTVSYSGFILKVCGGEVMKTYENLCPETKEDCCPPPLLFQHKLYYCSFTKWICWTLEPWAINAQGSVIIVMGICPCSNVILKGLRMDELMLHCWNGQDVPIIRLKKKTPLIPYGCCRPPYSSLDMASAYNSTKNFLLIHAATVHLHYSGSN